jgi:hypothetical protein
VKFIDKSHKIIVEEDKAEEVMTIPTVTVTYATTTTKRILPIKEEDMIL